MTTTRNYFQTPKAEKPKLKGIRRMSAKKAAELRRYTNLRAGFMAFRPTCEICKKSPATECHHKAGRGKNYLNVDTWLAVCPPCHRRIHNHPGQARAAGWLK